MLPCRAAGRQKFPVHMSQAVWAAEGWQLPFGLSSLLPESKGEWETEGTRGHCRPSALGPGTAILAAAMLCSAWTKMPLSAESLLRPPHRSSHLPGVPAGWQELPRGAVHLLQLPHVPRAHAPVEAPVPWYRGPGPPVGWQWGHPSTSEGSPAGGNGRRGLSLASGWQVGKLRPRGGALFQVTISSGSIINELASPTHRIIFGVPGSSGPLVERNCPTHKDTEAGTQRAWAGPDHLHPGSFFH